MAHAIYERKDFLNDEEYDDLSDRRKDKYIEKPKDALVMIEESQLVNTVTPSGTVSMKSENITKVWGEKIYFRKGKEILRKIDLSRPLYSNYEGFNKYTSIYYRTFKYYYKGFGSFLNQIGSFLYPSGPKGLNSYKNKQDYPGGLLDNYLK